MSHQDKLRWRNAASPPVLLLALFWLAFAVRLACLTCQSLWVDEISAVYWTTLPGGAMLLDIADNLHTPLYYLILDGWIALAGSSAFALRYLTVLSGLLLMPVLYSAARRLFSGRGTANLAALLGSISPAHALYSQEVRMYAFLPALYLPLLVHVLRGRPERTRFWLWLTLGSLAALYLHLFTVLLLLPAYLLLGWRLWRTRLPGTWWRRWLMSGLLAILGVAPWLLVLWQWGGDLPANLQDTTAGATVPVLSYLTLIWDFLLTGLTGLPAIATWLTRIVALGWALGLLTAARREVQLERFVSMGVAFGLPLVVAYGVWLFSPLTHPRYLLFLLAPLLLLEARVLVLLWEGSRPELRPPAVVMPVVLLGFLLLLGLMLSHGLAFRLALSDPDYQRFDMRGLATVLSRRASPGDLVLMPPYDWSLWYYPPTPADATNWDYAGGDPAAQGQALAAQLAGRHGVFFVHYRGLYDYDPLSQVPFLLELNGRLRERFTVDRMDVSYYELDGDWQSPQVQEIAGSCERLLLAGLAYEGETRPAEALTVALRWQWQEPVPDVTASLRLHPTGNQEQRLATVDVRLLDALGQRTSGWEAGTESTTFYTLPIPLGAIPGDYELTALVFREDGTPLCAPLTLAHVNVLSTPGQEGDPYGSWDVLWEWAAGDDVAPGLRLEGYSLDRDGLKPGQPFTMALRWRATRANLGAYEPRLQLRQNGAVLSESESELFQRYPSDRWQADELLIEKVTLTMPPTLSPVQLVVATENDSVPLTQVAVNREALLWEPPPSVIPVCAQFPGAGRLVGYRWEPPALTLYWQGGATAPADSSYTVFVHLVDGEGVLLAQDDGLPSEGERPTSTWLPGEVIADRHQLADIPAGAALRVGLYDLATGDRLPGTDCDGQPLLDEALILAVSD